jgi:hypothetical protein
MGLPPATRLIDQFPTGSMFLATGGGAGTVGGGVVAATGCAAAALASTSCTAGEGADPAPVETGVAQAAQLSAANTKEA